MATLVIPVEVQRQERSARKRDQGYSLLLVSGLTLLAFAIHGYHPYAEDGGLYVAGIKRLLNPALYPHSAAFVLEPTRFSLFAPMVAGLVRVSGLSLPAVLLLLHLASIWLTLFAAWMLAARCWPEREARAGAVVLLACWLTLPVAGTALFLMDPYLTARSISTPCALLALAAALDITAASRESPRLRPSLLLGGSLVLAALMHPLMAAYSGWAVLMLLVIRSTRPVIRNWGPPALGAATLAFAALSQYAAQPESLQYVRIALTRAYWFPSQWAWYELLGLAAPLVILAAIARSARRNDPLRHSASTIAALAQMAIALGVTAFVVAMLFAREQADKHLIARMQPLRAFQIVYLVMVLALGATLGEHYLRRSAWRWCAAIVLLASPLFAAQFVSFPSTNHLEIGSQPTRNPWAQAFLWVRDNTPQDALFALDADYIHEHGEDAQSFRAISERSALPDYSKDGGEASIAPDLTPAWTVGQAAQQHLSAPDTTDAQRIAVLRPLGVTWVVLRAGAQTDFQCPFNNAAVKVCRLE